MLNGDLPYDDANKEVVGIAFVRNPINRFISSYNFQRGASYRGGFARENDFDDFYTKALIDTADPMWRNGQTYVLGGSGTESGLAVISERIKKGRLVLLPTERFDESCLLLERLYPDDFKDCSYVARNVSKQHMPVSEQQKDAVAKFMDLDFKLCAMANQYLDTTLESLLPDGQARQRYLEDFHRRCKLKKRRNRLNYIATNPWGAAKVAVNKLMKLV
jgi:hypothetical protein